MTITEIFNNINEIIDDLKSEDITPKYAQKKLVELVNSAPTELRLLIKVPTLDELRTLVAEANYESSDDPEYESSQKCW